jgi:hypothetical protein
MPHTLLVFEGVLDHEVHDKRCKVSWDCEILKLFVGNPWVLMGDIHGIMDNILCLSGL